MEFNSTMLLSCNGISYNLLVKGSYLINIIAHVSANTFISIIAIGLNILLVVAILQHPILQTPPNILLFSSTINDILLSMSYLFGWNTSLLLAIFNIKNCSIAMTFTILRIFCITMSFLNTILMATDRYFAIFKPYQYRLHIHNNKKIYMKVVAFVWCSLVLISGLNLLTKRGLLMSIICKVVVVIALIWAGFTYVKIYFAVKKMQKSVPRRSKKDLNENRITKLTLLLLASLVLTNLPMFISLVLWVFMKNILTGKFVSLLIWIHTAFLTKGLANALLFGFSLSNVRSSIVNHKRTNYKVSHLKQKHLNRYSLKH